MPRQLTRSFRYLALSAVLSLLFAFHGVFVTRNLTHDNSKYFAEDDDSQWRLSVMMGRGAPFDNLMDELNNNDFDDASSNDSVVVADIELPSAATETRKQEDKKSRLASKTNKRGSNTKVKTAEQIERERLRPKRNPKGYRFRGWRHPEEFNFWENNGDRDNAWWRNNSRCFEIDYVCHKPHSNQWQYMTSAKWKERVFQPTMELKPSAAKYDGKTYNAELRIGIKVDSPKRLEEKNGGSSNAAKFSFDECQLSETNTHIVIQSLFNDMVGEFYSRSLLGLHQTMMMGAENNATVEGKPLPWEEDIQFYIHVPLEGKKVLDGHKLLTAGMLANQNAGMPKSFLDLFQQPDGEEGGANHNEDDCQCYKKMVFCGYDAYTHDEKVDSEDIDTVEEYHRSKKHRSNEDEAESVTDDDDEAGSTDDEEGEEDNNPKKKTSTEMVVSNDAPSFDPNLKYTLWSAGTIWKGEKHVKTHCVRGEDCQGYADLRNFMSLNFEKHYPNLSDDIVKFRREKLLMNSLIDEDYNGDTKEWIVVGLTQRTYRRSWLNLPTVMKECNSKFNDQRVVFIEVNVENTSSPYEQLILHRSLDVMIGVHGAQLTQAVVLPPHAHVLELLPWVPSYIRGAWVTRRNAPTPLGIIYHNTDLNHVGYSLDRSSTDLCVGVGDVGSEEEKECFLEDRKIFIWDNRDFNVEAEVVIQYIEKLVLFMRDDMGKLCSEITDRLDERFVLYNVWCSEVQGKSTSLFHYYDEELPRVKK